MKKTDTQEDAIPKREPKKKTPTGANLKSIRLPDYRAELFGLVPPSETPTPDIEKPENLKTGIPEIPETVIPESWISGNPEIPNSGNPESRVSGFQENPNYGIPEIRKTDIQENQKSGKQEKRKPVKVKEKLSLNIDRKRIKALKRYALDHNEFLGDCLEQAIDLLVFRKSGNRAEHDKELMIDDPDDGGIPSSILELYETMAGRRFSRDDRFAYREVAEAGEETILIGMYQTWAQKLGGSKKNEPINSFRYFHNEIKKCAAEQWEPDVLRYRLHSMEQKRIAMGLLELK